MEQEHKMPCVQYIWNVSSFKKVLYILIAWHFCIGIAHLFGEPHFRLCFFMFLEKFLYHKQMRWLPFLYLFFGLLYAYVLDQFYP